MTPNQYCEQKAAPGGSSLYYALLFLPPDRKHAMMALYALCRDVNDIADKCSDVGIAHTTLGWWRAEIASLYDGQPRHPVSRALAPAIRSFDLPQEQLQEIISGVEMDLDQHRYAKFDDLREYCTHAMSGVDVLSAKILGYIEPRTLSSAKTLGVAFRLTNIVRNIGKDARRGRIYLPIDELASFNVSISDIQHARETPNFKRLVEFQIMRVLGFYRDADALLLPIDRKAQRPRLVLEAIYRTLLDEILADGCCVLTRRLSLTPLRKLWITWKTRMME